jgi:hypothetical protein
MSYFGIDHLIRDKNFGSSNQKSLIWAELRHAIIAFQQVLYFNAELAEMWGSLGLIFELQGKWKLRSRCIDTASKHARGMAQKRSGQD